MLLTDYADFLQEFHFFPTSKGKKMLHDQIHSHNILFKTVFFLFDFHVWKYYPIPRSKSSEVILFSLLMCVWRSIIPNMWDAFSICWNSIFQGQLSEMLLGYHCPTTRFPIRSRFILNVGFHCLAIFWYYL